MANEKQSKKTVQYRFKVAKQSKDFSQEHFCGVVLAEYVASAKDAISRTGKLWAKTEMGADGKPTDKAIFPKSDKAYDYVEKELTDHVRNMVAQLRAGSKTVVKSLEPAPF